MYSKHYMQPALTAAAAVISALRHVHDNTLTFRSAAFADSSVALIQYSQFFIAGLTDRCRLADNSSGDVLFSVPSAIFITFESSSTTIAK